MGKGASGACGGGPRWCFRALGNNSMHTLCSKVCGTYWHFPSLVDSYLSKWPKVPWDKSCRTLPFYLTWCSRAFSLHVWPLMYELVLGSEKCLEFENCTWSHDFYWSDLSLPPRHPSMIPSTIITWGLTPLYACFFCTLGCFTLLTVFTNLRIRPLWRPPWTWWPSW